MNAKIAVAKVGLNAAQVDHPSCGLSYHVVAHAVNTLSHIVSYVIRNKMKVYVVINENGVHSVFKHQKDAQDMIDECAEHEIEIFELIE